MIYFKKIKIFSIFNNGSINNLLQTFSKKPKFIEKDFYKSLFFTKPKKYKKKKLFLYKNSSVKSKFFT